ncbi:STAS domain-containing protein [Streptomyces sp. NBC_00249]|uniref:STAS domain-containing protein n=1 Tax=Streptomyces sp. NBC_00249 TaxID=2975690 RepID=UPI002255F835|nr:STAS domain-containing protein [Streptomyces sp. NBC_00249]MCX5199158.1 STAS domain-containing protein [Streptomyces sp. NBC_00249]
MTSAVAVRSEADGVCVIVCSGEFDLHTSSVLAVACEREAAPGGLLVLDVAQVAFADSAFLTTLLWVRDSRRLVLAGPLPSQLRRLLEMTKVLDLFEIRDNTGQSDSQHLRERLAPAW